MTYIELLNAFWDSTRSNPSSCNESAMYLYLLHQCNIRRWINPFKFKTRNLELALGVSRATITAIRDKLKQRGVIDFGKGVGSGSSIYLICGVKVTDKALAEKICVQSKNTELNTNLNTNANSTLYIKDYIRHKDNTTSRDVVAAPPPVKVSLFAEEEKKAAGRKPKMPKESAPNPPSYEEVRQYFLLQDADKLLEDWEESCRRFFDYFTAVDWKDKSNRRITRWDSRANNWILDDEKRQKEKKANEIQNKPGAVGPNAPSSGVSIRGRVTPGCGLKRRNSGGET